MAVKGNYDNGVLVMNGVIGRIGSYLYQDHHSMYTSNKVVAATVRRLLFKDRITMFSSSSGETCQVSYIGDNKLWEIGHSSKRGIIAGHSFRFIGVNDILRYVSKRELFDAIVSMCHYETRMEAYRDGQREGGDCEELYQERVRKSRPDYLGVFNKKAIKSGFDLFLNPKGARNDETVTPEENTNIVNYLIKLGLRNIYLFDDNDKRVKYVVMKKIKDGIRVMDIENWFQFSQDLCWARANCDSIAWADSEGLKTVYGTYVKFIIDDEEMERYFQKQKSIGKTIAKLKLCQSSVGQLEYYIDGRNRISKIAPVGLTDSNRWNYRDSNGDNVRVLIPTSKEIEGLCGNSVDVPCQEAEIVIGSNIKYLAKNFIKEGTGRRKLKIEYKGDNSSVMQSLYAIANGIHSAKSSWYGMVYRNSVNIELTLHHINKVSDIMNVTTAYNRSRLYGVSVYCKLILKDGALSNLKIKSNNDIREMFDLNSPLKIGLFDGSDDLNSYSGGLCLSYGTDTDLSKVGFKLGIYGVYTKGKKAYRRVIGFEENTLRQVEWYEHLRDQLLDEVRLTPEQIELVKNSCKEKIEEIYSIEKEVEKVYNAIDHFTELCKNYGSLIDDDWNGADITKHLVFTEREYHGKDVSIIHVRLTIGINIPSNMVYEKCTNHRYDFSISHRLFWDGLSEKDCKEVEGDISGNTWTAINGTNVPKDIIKVYLSGKPEVTDGAGRRVTVEYDV